MNGLPPPKPIMLKERVSMLFLEYGELDVLDGAFVLIDKTGIRTHIPVGSIACLMLQPGTRVSHASVVLAARVGTLLRSLMEMGTDSTDPVEPPPLGDVELADVRRQYGQQLVLFGNLELRDIETLPPAEFEQVVARSLRDGTAGAGRGFVLMPSACPCGRHVTPRAVANYETMVRLTTGS